MRRPLKDKRPVGPFVSSDKFTKLGFQEGSGKEVIGISGTPFPQNPKEDLLVIYVLGDGTRVFESRQFADDVQRKINGRNEFEGFGVRFLKSGTSAKKQFKEQAVMVRVPADHIAITESDLEVIQGIIERNLDGIEVKERIYEMEGTP